MSMASKEKLKLEYEFRASPAILYDFLTNPSNLAQWFADHCDVNGDKYSFVWNGYEEIVIAEELDENEYVKWIWEDDDEKIIEFKISKADISNATILTIIDNVDADEVEDSQLLWDEQISTLKTKCGG